MAEIHNDLKLSALTLDSTSSNAAPQPTYSDGAVTFKGNRNLRVEDSGRIHFCASGGTNGAVIKLPATKNLSLGDRYTLVQDTTPAAEFLVIRTNTSADTFSEGSYLVNSNADVGGHAAELVQPGNVTCQAFLVRNAATTAAHGVGSTVDCQVVAPNRWLLVGRSEPLGTGLPGATNYQWLDDPADV
jgi:hypothetical protein